MESSRTPSSCFVFCFLLACCSFVAVPCMAQTLASDQACVPSLEILVDCLPYAQGKAQLPSPTCCTNLQKVVQTQQKCLCELIIASTQGDASGLPALNQTLALQLPVACNVPADPSKCPGLLGISASSAEARIFSTQVSTSSTTTNGASTGAASNNGAKGSAPSNSVSSGSIKNASRSLPFVGALVILLKIVV